VKHTGEQGKQLNCERASEQPVDTSLVQVGGKASVSKSARTSSSEDSSQHVDEAYQVHMLILCFVTNDGELEDMRFRVRKS